MEWLWIAVAACGAFFIFITLIFHKVIFGPKVPSLEKRHVVVTGGSSGIGKCIAIEAAKLGANISIIARNSEKLESAKTEIQKACKDPETQKVQCISLDLSDNYEAIDKAFGEMEESLGPIYLLVNCAGLAICGKLEDTSVDDIKYLMNVNFFGTVYPTKAVISRMKDRQEGRIVITSSQAGLFGIFGLSCYSATKFALRGLAEALHMEAKPYNITVTLSLPADTDTPGFENEQKSKPQETRLISESAGLLSPEVVAKKTLQDALNGQFMSSVGFEGFMMTTLCAGMSPVTCTCQFVLQNLFMGLLRFVSIFYLNSFDKMIKNCMKSRDETKKSE